MEFIKQQIMYQRHQFIYGYNTQDRKDLLTSLVKEYPIKIDEDRPMAIYLDTIGLPNIGDPSGDVDEIKLCTLSREYLNFTIAYNILKEIQTNVDIECVKEKREEFMAVCDKFDIDYDSFSIKSLAKILDILQESRTFYSEYYVQYLKCGVSNLNIETLRRPFLMLDSFLRGIKELLNNQSYFCVIADQHQMIPIISRKAINTLVTMRITGDLSMKVACHPEEWDTYYGLNDVLAELTHDYGIVELDDSHAKHIQKIKSRYGF